MHDEWKVCWEGFEGTRRKMSFLPGQGVGGPGTPPSRSSCPLSSCGEGSLPASLWGLGLEGREGDSVAESRPLTSAEGERGLHDPSCPGSGGCEGAAETRIDPHEVSVVTQSSRFLPSSRLVLRHVISWEARMLFLASYIQNLEFGEK